MNEIDVMSWLLAGVGVLLALSAFMVALTLMMVLQAKAYLRQCKRNPFMLLARERDLDGRPRRERI